MLADIAPDAVIDEFTQASWFRDYGKPVEWIAAALCEAQLFLEGKRRCGPAATAVIRERANSGWCDGWPVEDLRAYVEHRRAYARRVRAAGGWSAFLRH